MNWDQEEEFLKYSVRDGGGIWEGIQPDLIRPGEASVIFRCPDDGAILECDVHECTWEKVKCAIFQHRNRNTIKIPRFKVIQLLDKLTELASEVKQIIEEK